LRIAVLCGGAGAEREVSLRSGGAIARALRTILDDNSVRLVDLHPDAPLPRAVLEADAALLALHGNWGEDGSVQGVLEEAGVPYLGSSSEASRCAFDKELAKAALREHGIPTPDSLVVEEASALRPDELVDALGLPLFVKPVAEGSSVGVSLACTRSALTDAVVGLLGRGYRVLVEQPVMGKELTLAVLDGEALPLVHIVTPREFFDYEAKYEDGATRYYLELGLTAEEEDEVVALALGAYEALGCRHLARVDLMHDGASAWVLEVNTLPGMTERSLMPMAAQAAGLSFGDLCACLVRMVRRDSLQPRSTGAQGVA